MEEANWHRINQMRDGDPNLWGYVWEELQVQTNSHLNQLLFKSSHSDLLTTIDRPNPILKRLYGKKQATVDVNAYEKVYYLKYYIYKISF